MTDKSRTPILAWIVLGMGAIALALMIGIHVIEISGILDDSMPDVAHRSGYVNMYVVIAQLIYCFAFIAFIVMFLMLILLQSHELKLQRKELAATRTEITGQLEAIRKELKAQRDVRRETASD